ncbi:MAG TPA: hypothetical protein VFP55_01585 [Solirubrobacteraceae bacterium]|nr:hypothetical protein [Solirubrobacteraceae bacterium]
MPARPTSINLEPGDRRKLAADLFNYVWTLLEKTGRSPDETERMIHAAHASRLFWEGVGEPVNLARGEWQLSRVYSVLARPKPALDHAARCLAICRQNAIGGFDLAYAHEALARARSVAGDREGAAEDARLARAAAAGIEDAEDREMLLRDLSTLAPGTRGEPHQDRLAHRPPAEPGGKPAMFPNPSGLVYGTLVVGALLAAESTRRETFGATVGALAVTLMLYWLAHAYSELTEHRLQTGSPITLASVTRTLAHELTILAGAAMPLVALLFGWAAGAALEAAVNAAIWTSVGMIIAIELLAGVRGHLKGGQLATQIAAGVLFGLLVIVLHIVLH